MVNSNMHAALQLPKVPVPQGATAVKKFFADIFFYMQGVPLSEGFNGIRVDYRAGQILYLTQLHPEIKYDTLCDLLLTTFSLQNNSIMEWSRGSRADLWNPVHSSRRACGDWRVEDGGYKIPFKYSYRHW